MAGVYDFSLQDLAGREQSLAQYKGKVLLIVNVASKCGFTPQYKGLQELYERYRERGLVILGFPANNFLWQEPGSNEEIRNFCSLKYQVTFPMFTKIDVKGRKIAPLYRFLTSRKTNPAYGGKVKWNFTKFLVDKEGHVAGRFEPATEPLAGQVTARIEELLA